MGPVRGPDSSTVSSTQSTTTISRPGCAGGRHDPPSTLGHFNSWERAHVVVLAPATGWRGRVRMSGISLTANTPSQNGTAPTVAQGQVRSPYD